MAEIKEKAVKKPAVKKETKKVTPKTVVPVELNRNNRKTFTGIVSSDKTDKTITVVVNTYKTHALYGKRIKVTKKFHVHDEENVAKTGDKVIIMETRPISKTKTYRLVNVVEKATLI